MKWENVRDGIPQTFAQLKYRLDTKAAVEKKEKETKEKAKTEKDEALEKAKKEAEDLKAKIEKEEKHQQVGAPEPVVTVISVSTEEAVST
jgi:hypothetical protein